MADSVVNSSKLHQAPAPVIGATSVVEKPKENGQTGVLDARYNELVKMIAEIGKDVKPSYTNSKVHADRLKKNIGTTRSVLRECLLELDRLSRMQLQEEQRATKQS